MSVVELIEAQKSYMLGETRMEALRGVCIRIEKGEFLAIAGPSGAGKLGFIFQSFNLIPVLNVFENVEFPLLLQRSLSRKQREQTAMHFVEEVGLADRVKNKPNELSGGQRQRVAIARALVAKPLIVLADEPTANLDSETGHRIVDLMRAINEQERTTFIFSTHDEHIMEHARRVISLRDGLVTADELKG